jgi:hypothetical protein
MSDGMHDKYRVEKINDPTGKHADCRYFVLDPKHDPLAREALLRYSMLARHAGNAALAADLDDWLQALSSTPAETTEGEARG